MRAPRPAGGPRTCAAPGEGSTGRRASRGSGCAGCVRDAHPCTWGAAAGAHTVCDLRVQSGAPPHPTPPHPPRNAAPLPRARLGVSFAPGECGVAFAAGPGPGAQTGALGGTCPSYWCWLGPPGWGWGSHLAGGGWQLPGPAAPPLWRQLRPFGVRPASVSLTCPGCSEFPGRAAGTGTPHARGSGRALVFGTSFHPIPTQHPCPILL